jgi:hypothetical protein
MKWLALFAVGAVLACAPIAPTPEAPPASEASAPVTPAPGQSSTGAQGEDTCGMAAHQSLIGKLESEIDRSSLPAGARIICPQCMVTQDYSPNRLNLFTNTEGRVASMRCF